MKLSLVLDVLRSGAIGAPLGYDDFFARTWQCSHVRYCCGLWDADDYSHEEALAWILKRNESDYKTKWIDSLAASTIRPIDIEEIKSSIPQTVNEIRDSDHLANPPAFPLTDSDLTDATAAARIDGLSLYDYGPTAAYVWGRACEFNYLELHYES